MLKVVFSKSMDQSSKNVTVAVGFSPEGNVFSSENLGLMPLLNKAVKKVQAIPDNDFYTCLLAESEQFNHAVLAKIKSPATLTIAEVEALGANIFKQTATFGTQEVVVCFGNAFTAEQHAHLAYGFYLHAWSFDQYKTEKKAVQEVAILRVLCDAPEKAQELFNPFAAIVEGFFLAKNVITQPANVMTPLAFASVVQSLTRLDTRAKVTVLKEQELTALGFNALLAVGQGSDKESCVVVVEWAGGARSDAPIALIGKGVCFDSGGISIKPAAKLDEMKWDMAGAGAILGVMHAAIKNNMPLNLVAVLGMVENMPDGKALKPGDIIKSLSGKTIEVLDTDAEGRLVLADCLWYAQEKFKPVFMVDMATLTYDTISTLSNCYAGLYADDDKLATLLIASGIATGEKVWRLPQGVEFAKKIESDFADMKNVSSTPTGDNGVAAEFLKKFTNNVPLAHIDFAGVAWSDEDTAFAKKGVTGFGVRLLVNFLLKF